MSAPEEIISDADIIRVHGHANFGDMSPREVVNDGVRKYSVGFTGGHTQLCILLEHGLITKPKPGKYSANLTQKGKRYARSIWNRRADLTPPAADYVAGLEKALRMAKSSIENGGGGGVIDVVWCDGDIPETVCDHIETALAARPASPDTRTVTVDQLREWAKLMERSSEITAIEISYIADGGQDRG